MALHKSNFQEPLYYYFFSLKRGTTDDKSRLSTSSSFEGREDSQRHFSLPLATSLASTLAAGFKPETTSFWLEGILAICPLPLGHQLVVELLYYFDIAY